MARRSSGSQLARRRLGTSLRRLREDANIRIDAAARELECSTAKISRLENGLGPAKLWDVRILLDLYGLRDAETRAQFEEWARDSKAVGWWESDADLTTDDVARYLAAETEAARVQIYTLGPLPSQLQTAEYARAHISALHPDWTPEDVERFTELRAARRAAVLDIDDPVTFDVIVDEGAVWRQVGSPDVHLDQLRWLAATLDESERKGRTDLTFRIRPFVAGPSRAVEALTIFHPRRPDLDPVLAHAEGAFGGSWAEGDTIDAFIAILAAEEQLALAPRESRQLLGAIIRALQTEG